jgi:hypothetical protein
MPPSVMVVNLIPRSLSGETNGDAEPNLAVNPANPNQIAATAFTPNPAGAGDAPIYVSGDGGKTWALQAIVPSDRMTADITIRFGSTSNCLYAGIIRTPLNPNAPALNILRTTNVLSGSPMSVLVKRQGKGVDQPYIQAASLPKAGGGGSVDVVICGDNDFNNSPGTANLDVSGSAAGSPAKFKSSAVDVRTAVNGDAPSIRPAIHSDGTVYGAFLSRIGGTTNSNLRYNVVVVRDDNRGSSTPPFASLKDSGDNKAGAIVTANRLIPFLNQSVFGQERIGSTLTIGVDPRNGQSGTVFLAWADRVGTTDYTIHLVNSTNKGQAWSKDLLTITNATNPAVAINSNGVIGFVYQQLTGTVTPGKVTATNRWETHFRTSTDGGKTWSDMILATTPANAPAATGLPYLGDYLHLMAIGVDFYGVFSANNTPDLANFPNGVTFQRNTNMQTHQLLDVDGVTPVDVSIDPFFFKITL